MASTSAASAFVSSLVSVALEEEEEEGYRATL